jgi:hypothetical protein
MDEDQKERGVRSWMLRHLGMISEEDMRIAAGFDPQENVNLPINSVNLGRRDWYPVVKLRAYLESQIT